MPSSYTTSLRLTLPATGELAGQWGSTVNTGITELLDAAVAGTTVISTWGGAGVPYTLSNNSGTADEARKMFIVATGTPGEAKNVICPAVSKLYVFRNDTTGGFALTLKTSGGTGIAVPAGQYKMLYCDGTNVVEAVNSPGPVASLSASQAVFTDGSKNLVSNAVTGTGNVVMSASPTLTGTVAGASLQLSSLTSGRVTYAGASGLLQDSTNLTFDGTSLTLGGNPTLSAGTANGVLYLNGSKVATSGSALTFDGTTLVSGTGIRANSYMEIRSNTAALYWENAANTLYWSQNLTGSDFTWNYFNGTSLAEQMRLTSTGLGIGTTPTSKLEVWVPGTTGSTSIMRLTRGVGYGTTEFKQYYTSGTDYGLTIGNTLSDLLTLNLASGNLGLGLTPSAWGTGAAQQAAQVSLAALSYNGASNTASRLTHNAYFDGTNWRYISSAIGATRYEMTGANAGSTHSWSVSAGGTAGNAISFTQAMTLSAGSSPALRVGVTADLQGFSFQAANTVGFSIHNAGSTATAAYFSAANNVSLTSSGNFAVINGADGILFGAGTTERARITSGGYFKASNSGAYTNSTGVYHELYQDNNSGGNQIAIFRNAAATATNQYGFDVYLNGDPNDATRYFARGYGNVTERWTIRSNGGLANYSGNDVNLSDRREKTNFAPAKPYLDTICAIPVQTFNYIDQSEDDPGLTLGVVAQDVQAVAPELVMESNWGTAEDPKMRLSIYQTDLQYALMKCIQELKAQNDELRARVAALEAQP